MQGALVSGSSSPHARSTSLHGPPCRMQGVWIMIDLLAACRGCQFAWIHMACSSHARLTNPCRLPSPHQRAGWITSTPPPTQAAQAKMETQEVPAIDGVLWWRTSLEISNVLKGCASESFTFSWRASSLQKGGGLASTPVRLEAIDGRGYGARAWHLTAQVSTPQSPCKGPSMASNLGTQAWQ